MCVIRIEVSFWISHRSTISWLHGKPGFAKVSQLQNENFIKANINYQGLFWVVGVKMECTSIFGSRINLASYCCTYHAMSPVLEFLLYIIIFKTRILAFIHLPSEFTWLFSLRSGCVSLFGWFTSLYIIESKIAFLCFQKDTFFSTSTCY